MHPTVATFLDLLRSSTTRWTGPSLGSVRFLFFSFRFHVRFLPLHPSIHWARRRRFPALLRPPPRFSWASECPSPTPLQYHLWPRTLRCVLPPTRLRRWRLHRVLVPRGRARAGFLSSSRSARIRLVPPRRRCLAFRPRRWRAPVLGALVSSHPSAAHVSPSPPPSTPSRFRRRIRRRRRACPRRTWRRTRTSARGARATARRILSARRSWTPSPTFRRLRSSKAQ
mmetsp:Transcript_9859/g.60028  ORF Transcript_9859/g.60028 Transcript_9859/m.60028 type:complete len:226 (+) Transcript_9859:3386-4063(+)